MYIVNPCEANKVCCEFCERNKIRKKDFYYKSINEPVAIKICFENIPYLNSLFDINVGTVDEFYKTTKEKFKGLYKSCKAENKKRIFKGYVINLYFIYNDVCVERLFKSNRFLNWKEFKQTDYYHNPNIEIKVCEYNVIRKVIL